MKVFYHNDLDGRCAAAIVWKSIREHNITKNCDFIEMDYKDDILIDNIGIGEGVIIVDFSFKPDVMEEVLKRTKSVIWIDHHKTAFEYDYGVELEGLRDTNYSGCELAWQFYFPDEPMNNCVKLIGDRDKWAWKYGHTTAVFNEGIKCFSTYPQSGLWDELFNNDEFMVTVEESGSTCLMYRDNFCEDYAYNYGWETNFEGYICFANGIYAFGSEAFGDRMKQYDICLSYEFLGDRWIVGLYSDTIDVSGIAVKHGGGGHKGAAGFVCEDLPFKKLMKDENERTNKSNAKIKFLSTWNLMTEDEQKYLQQQVLARLDRRIAEEEYKNEKRKD